MHASTMNLNLHTDFYICQYRINNAEFRDDEDNESCSGGSNVYLQQFLHLWSNMCMYVSIICKNVHAHFYIWQQFLNSAEFESDEENESWLGGSNVYSQKKIALSNAVGPHCRAKGPIKPHKNYVLSHPQAVWAFFLNPERA